VFLPRISSQDTFFLFVWWPFFPLRWRVVWGCPIQAKSLRPMASLSMKGAVKAHKAMRAILKAPCPKHRRKKAS
jgi:hypothetical protein